MVVELQLVPHLLLPVSNNKTRYFSQPRHFPAVCGDKTSYFKPKQDLLLTLSRCFVLKLKSDLNHSHVTR